LKLTSLREARGLNKSDLARMTGKQPSRIGALENHRATPPKGSKELADIARVLGFQGNPDELLDPVDDPEYPDAA
jgi:transcriptional regulator with XRE-family HTH domain